MGSVLDQDDRALGAGPFGLFGQVDHVCRDVDRVLAPDRDVALVVVAQKIGRDLVTASVTGALGGVDLQLHDDSSQRNGSLFSDIIAPPPRSNRPSSPASSKSGISRSHSSTATCISRRARCIPRQRCGPFAKPMWLFRLRSITNSSARSHAFGSRLAAETSP